MEIVWQDKRGWEWCVSHSEPNAGRVYALSVLDEGGNPLHQIVDVPADLMRDLGMVLAIALRPEDCGEESDQGGESDQGERDQAAAGYRPAKPAVSADLLAEVAALSPPERAQLAARILGWALDDGAGVHTFLDDLPTEGRDQVTDYVAGEIRYAAEE